MCETFYQLKLMRLECWLLCIAHMIDSYVFWSTFTVGQEADAESFLQIYSSIKCTKIIMILVYCYTFLWENSYKKGMSQSLEMVFGNLFFTGPSYQKVLHTYNYKIWISLTYSIGRSCHNVRSRKDLLI